MLDREEFLLLCSVFYESLLMRIATQSTVSLLLAPLAASHIVELCAELPVRGGAARAAAQTFGNVTFRHLPERLQPMVGSRSVAVTGVAATLVAVLVPLFLSLIDEYYLLRAARKTSRKLFKRRSMATQMSMQVAVAGPAALAAQVTGEKIPTPTAIRAYAGDVLPTTPVSPPSAAEEEVVMVDSAATVDSTDCTSATPAAVPTARPAASGSGLPLRRVRGSCKYTADS